ncbi:thioesterase domain-containing protein [Aspergillus undulatus]|uniref:thioesterase domain-containing protein n=1 Tax=Aspergillus undulatus TaxID=1810928 RepID=UPI003CCD87A1
METVVHIQGNPSSPLTPLILIHAISGMALPYFALGSLSSSSSYSSSYSSSSPSSSSLSANPSQHDDSDFEEEDQGRPVYGLSSPIFESPSAFYRHGKSLPSLAREYVNIIRRDIQPHGPYLLGGWSMGGMIAVEMAAILTAQGETVKHVLMIDSINPTRFLPFQNVHEHLVLSTLTYNAIASRIEGSSGMDMDTDNTDTDACMSMMMPTSPISTSSEVSSGASTIMTASSDNSPENSDSGFTSDSDYGDDDDEDGLDSMAGFMQLIREHVSQGLRMLAAYPKCHRPVYLPKTAVTLIKCTTLDSLSPLIRDERKAFASKTKLDPRNGWRPEQFKSFVSVPFAATHDGCFDEGASGKLTVILRDVLKDIM